MIAADILTFFLSGFRAYRSRIYGGPTPSALSLYAIARGSKGRAHGLREANHDSCDTIYRRLYGRHFFQGIAGEKYNNVPNNRDER